MSRQLESLRTAIYAETQTERHLSGNRLAFYARQTGKIVLLCKPRFPQKDRLFYRVLSAADLAFAPVIR